MPSTKRIVIGQINFRVGDIDYNTATVIAKAKEAKRDLQADAILFPEMTLMGYSPDDLVYRDEIYPRLDQALADICREVPDIDIILGLPYKQADTLYNAAVFIEQGKISQRYFKQCLPNYSVFDEKRYFGHGEQECVFDWHGIRIALLICEDMWHPEPMQRVKAQGAQLVLGLNASPFNYSKAEQRLRVLKQRVQENKLAIIYSHWVGGQDEIVFDGGSVVLNNQGEVAAMANFFEEQLLAVDIEVAPQLKIITQELPPPMPKLARIYQALVLGTRDYLEKNNAKGALIGLSGGIDSALVIAIAVDAIGADNVEAVMMPSPYTAQISRDDAATIAKNLGVDYHALPIEPSFDSVLATLADRFDGLAPDITEENIQARLRGLFLMAIANKTGKLVLTTGNKSEMAVGYSTLYGDTAGAFAVIKDVLKTLVYDLVRYRNSCSHIIPERVLTRAPSAELAPDQTDQQSLPPYDILDQIITAYVEADQSAADIIAQGFDTETVEKVLHLIDRNEYKRRQCPPGIRITTKAFGRDRRYPITSGFKSKPYTLASPKWD